MGSKKLIWLPSRRLLPAVQCTKDNQIKFNPRTVKMLMDYFKVAARYYKLKKKETYPFSGTDDVYPGHNICASKKALCSLSRKTFNELYLQISNPDCYVVGRVISMCHDTDCHTMLFEDELENVILLRIYNILRDEHLHFGDVVIVKEPYFYQVEFKFPAIRCDSPTDYNIIGRESTINRHFHLIEHLNWITMPKYDTFDKEAKGLERTGDIYATWKAYGTAIDFYLGALGIRKKIDHFMLGLYIKLIKMYKGMQNLDGLINILLDLTVECPKLSDAFFWLAQEFYCLRKFDLANDFVGQCLQIDPGHRKAIEFVEFVNMRLLEESHSDKAFESLKNTLKCADFYSDGIEYGRERGYGGRKSGVFAKFEIQPETILVISQAFATSYDIRHKINDIKLKTDYLAHCREIIQDVALKMSRSSNFYHENVFGLDTFKKRENTRMYCDGDWELIVDVPLIIDVTMYNNFVVYDKGFFYGLALYGKPSYFNHDCKPNAYCIFHLDYVTIITSKLIAKGEEITFDYFPQMDNVMKHRTLTERHIICNHNDCTHILVARVSNV